MADDKTSKWPDLAKAVTFLTVLIFAASLAFVAGICQTLGQNLFGLFDLADYLRIAPAWIIPAFGSYVLMIAAHFADYKDPVLEPSKSEDERQKEFSAAMRSNYIWIGVLVLIAFVAWVVDLSNKSNSAVAGISGGLGWVASILASQRLAFAFLPGYIRFFRLTLEFTMMIPKAVVVCAAAFFQAVFIFDSRTESAQQRSVTMKDNTVLEGRVIFELSRYLVLRNSEGKLVAIQDSEIETMDFLTPKTTAVTATNPTPSPSPSTASTSKK